MHILDNFVTWLFVSFIAGVFGVQALRSTPLFAFFDSFSVFREPKHYELVGIRYFKILMVKSPLRVFNREIKLAGKQNLESMKSVRIHMINSEVGHWIGFLLMFVLTIAAWYARGYIIGIGYVISNLFGNVYPSLLQQYNKQRLGRLIEAKVSKSDCIQERQVQ